MVKDMLARINIESNIAMLDLNNEFTNVIQTLEQHNIEYAVCGALALAILKRPRFTRDIDILIRPKTYPDCRKALAQVGFRFASSPHRFGESVEIHKIKKIDSETNDFLYVDLVVALSASVQNVLDQRVRGAWQDQLVWVVSEGGLLQLKRLSARQRDRRDVEVLAG